MEGVESKLMSHWHHLDDVHDDFNPTQKTEFYTRKHSTMPVTIVVNGQKSRCKNNPRCRQVNFRSKNFYDIDREYPTDSDEDLFFKSEPHVYSEKRNQLKSRRAADDGYFPRLIPDNTLFNNFPQPAPIPKANMQLFNLQKPKWIEKLETESSLERSERVNKDLGNLMKLVAVWAHLDKFVTGRARSVVQKIVNMDDPLQNNNLLGSSNPNADNCDDLRDEVRKLKELMPKKDEPFT